MIVRSDVIPEEFLAAATAKRAELIETLAEVDDEIADAWLEEREISGLEIAVRDYRELLNPPTHD